jgi:DNA primase
MTSSTDIKWADWGEQLNYTSNQFLSTSRVVLSKKSMEKYGFMERNAMVESFLISSRVLASFFTQTKPNKQNDKNDVSEDYYMRQLDPNFQLDTDKATSEEKSKILREWKDSVSRTVAHMCSGRSTMLRMVRSSNEQEIVTILQELIETARSKFIQHHQQDYTWIEGVIHTGYYSGHPDHPSYTHDDHSEPQNQSGPQGHHDSCHHHS